MFRRQPIFHKGQMSRYLQSQKSNFPLNDWVPKGKRGSLATKNPTGATDIITFETLVFLIGSEILSTTNN